MLQQVKGELRRIGFSFHTDETGVWWYCWGGPNNKWDIECGPNCTLENDAALSALVCLVDYTKLLDRNAGD